MSLISIVPIQEATAHFVRMTPRPALLRVTDPRARIVLLNGEARVSFNGSLSTSPGADAGPLSWLLTGEEAVAEGLAQWVEEQVASEKPVARARECLVCGRSTAHDPNRCTNGCCGDCHREFCTTGGATSPGHGINFRAARETIARRAAQRVEEAAARRAAGSKR